MSSNDSKGAVLVTGAAGFIASHLIETLLERKIPVVGIDNFDPFYAKERKLRNLEEIMAQSKRQGTAFTFIEADLNELRAETFRGHSLRQVVHLAAKAGVRPSLEQPEAYVRANINGTVRLLEVCRELGVRTFAFGSSSSVYGNDTPVPFSEDKPAARPISPYAATKRGGEMLCASYAHLYGFRLPMLRFFTVYGPRQRPDLAIHKFARLIRDGEPLTLYGDGRTSRDYTFVSDIVDGILKSLDWAERSPEGACEAFNLGNSSPVSLIQLVELLQEKLGTKANLRWEKMQPGDVEHTYADISKSGRLLGYAPKVPLPDGIQRFVEWLRTGPR